VFESHRRRMILRTWTVGAYPIGDFIWHEQTLSCGLQGIDSPYFILSMKPGESDFFRYLPLNRHFFSYSGKKIIELQARREYEGAGEYPAFIGWEYGDFARQLAKAENMVGISTWCQTGGWLPFRRLSFLEPEGLWNEINAYVILKLFRDGLSVEEAIQAMAMDIGCSNPGHLIELLRLSEEVICEGLYIEEVARRQLYFRRVRIPPLMTVYWDSIFISHSLRKLLGLLCESGEESVTRGRQAVTKVERMEELAMMLGLPADDLRFMADTFGLLALAREYYFLPFSEEIRQRLKTAKKVYKERHPKGLRPRYRIRSNYTPFTMRSRHLRWLLGVAVRRRKGYRLLDHLLVLHVTAWLFRLLRWLRPDLFPKFARKRAMGVQAVFR